ncbi:MAG TPA: hypothetical protein VMU84_19530 [Thermoanaerobaculia bacterium]|nr:hypothetical protein [Thermoanaerobaculia bacterium]
MRIRLFTLALFFVTGAALAKNVTKSERFVQDLNLLTGGSLVVENPFGDILIVGADKPGMHAVVTKTMIGVDDDAIGEAREGTELRAAGNEKTRVLRTIAPLIRSPRWSAKVSYQIQVPRTTNIRVSSNVGDVRIANLDGTIAVNSFAGTLILQNTSGETNVASVNGTIIFDPNGKPESDTILQTLNGDIQVLVSPDANFEWIADTLTGQYRTTLGVRGRYLGTSFRGGFNAPGGPVIHTSTALGQVYMLKKGSLPTQARDLPKVLGLASTGPSGPPVIREFREQSVGELALDLDFVNVFVGSVEGSASVRTGAGEIHIGSIRGTTNVDSGGGPLSFGDAFGPIIAHTEAGDVIVNAARSRSNLGTNGGVIRLAFSAGPATLESGGGDIILRHAASSVNAMTKSGDITINLDPGLKTNRVIAKTGKGNIAVNVSPRFAADVQLTVLTSDPDANVIQTDFQGLAYSREQVGGKTRIRATGKINGGGDKVELSAEDGGIQFMSHASVLSAR